MKSRIFPFFLLLLIFLVPSYVYADIIPYGVKGVSWCYEVSNLQDYPDYVFVHNDERVSDPGIINQGDCFYFYKNGRTKIYAIKKSEFNNDEINRDFFYEGNPTLIGSDNILYPYGLVSQNEPLTKAVITLQLNSLNNQLDIQKEKITYTYLDGTVEEKVFQSQDIFPEPSKQAILPWWFAQLWYIILPLLAVLIIGIILLVRKIRK